MDSERKRSLKSQGKGARRDTNASGTQRSSSPEEDSPRRDLGTQNAGQSKADESMNMSRPTLDVIQAEVLAARGSTRALLKLKPVSALGIPLDASAVDHDPNPLASIQFCQNCARL